MDDDELEPLRTGTSEAKNLELLSVDELETYIARLESEIERARAAIESKRAQQSAAEALFGRSES